MITAIIQARMSSTRLPGKVLLEVMGKPLIIWMIERIKASAYVDRIVVATSADKSDDPLVSLMKEKNISYVRGSLDDVLDRYYQAARKFNASVVIRLTGDCPLMDPKILDQMVLNFELNDCDYLANTAPPQTSTYPDGMDVEIFSFAALERAWKEAKKPSEREHVTFYFWKNPDKFRIHQHCLNHNLSDYRLTVDYPEDFEVIKRIITSLAAGNKLFGMKDIVAFLKRNGDIRALNGNIHPNQGWEKSLEDDRETKLAT